jgi:hypothetical protein
MSTRRSFRRERVLGALAVRPMHIRDLCDHLRCDYIHLADVLKNMRDDESIIVVGTCGECGIPSMRKDAPIYALPGTEQLKPAPITQGRTACGQKAGRITIGKQCMNWPGPRKGAG